MRDYEKLSDSAVAALAADGVERLLPDAASPYLLIAEHAGNVVPAPWRDLGLAEPYLDTHFAVDIGVDLAQYLQRALGPPPPVGPDRLAHIVAGGRQHRANVRGKSAKGKGQSGTGDVSGSWPRASVAAAIRL